MDSVLKYVKFECLLPLSLSALLASNLFLSAYQCPYDVVVPTMRQGIEMAMMFTSMFSGAAASPPAARKQAEL